MKHGPGPLSLLLSLLLPSLVPRAGGRHSLAPLLPPPLQALLFSSPTGGAAAARHTFAGPRPLPFLVDSLIQPLFLLPHSPPASKRPVLPSSLTPLSCSSVDLLQIRAQCISARVPSSSLISLSARVSLSYFLVRAGSPLLFPCPRGFPSLVPSFVRLRREGRVAFSTATVLLLLLLLFSTAGCVCLSVWIQLRAPKTPRRIER